ncbi:MAG: hypothetical protein KDE50_12985, partial [Caldilineaceae bacterium]|nr:hypothetical protein [Caldilineaceae bacterium]
AAMETESPGATLDVLEAAGIRERADMVVVDTEQFQLLPATIAVARTYLAQSHGDLDATVVHGQRALRLLPPESHLQRGQASALLGLVYWARGELDKAYHFLTTGMASLEKTDNHSFALSGTYGLADIRIAQGRLREARQIYRQALQRVASTHDYTQNEAVPVGAAELHLGLSELHMLLGELQTAQQEWQKSAALSEHAALPTWPYRAALMQARMAIHQGELDNALAALDQAAQRYFRGPVPDVRPIAAWRARVWIMQARFTEALGWAHEQGLTVDDELSYLREFEHMTLARLLIAQYGRQDGTRTLADAQRLLARLLQAAQAAARMGSVIEILVLQALAHQAQAKILAALQSLEQALLLAEPEGYVQTFVGEGEPMAQLLATAAARGILSAYTAKLLAFFPNGGGTSWASANDAKQPSAMVEPLSERELEVLELIAQGLSNREISQRLYIALSTVKGHNRVIFGKLQVQRRTEAVARARALGLV